MRVRREVADLCSLEERKVDSFDTHDMPTLLHCLSKVSQLNRREAANFAICFRNWTTGSKKSQPAAPKTPSNDGSKNTFT